MELIFIFGCTSVAFFLLLLAFLMKGRDQPRPTCGRCSCRQTPARHTETSQIHLPCKNKPHRMSPVDSKAIDSTSLKRFAERS